MLYPLAKISGIVGSLFKIGDNQIKSNSGVLEVRNIEDTNYARLKFADPTDAQDGVTLNYFSAIGGLRVEVMPITISTTVSTNTIIQNKRVISLFVSIETPYTAGTTLKVGSESDDDMLLGTSIINPTVAGSYKFFFTDLWPADEKIKVTIVGSPIAGSGLIIMEYV